MLTFSVDQLHGRRSGQLGAQGWISKDEYSRYESTSWNEREEDYGDYSYLLGIIF